MAMVISSMCNTQALLGVHVLLIVLDYMYLTYSTYIHIHIYTYVRMYIHTNVS